ncbi:hypothetical protein [Demequina aurantiaca]|uniref:hypothetical protein n=1 Tax=Demequina aurantiaca TaxID=676200 RepID=UPI003D32ECE0
MMGDSVRSYGGAAGQDAVIEDLEHAAGLIRSAGDSLVAASQRVAQAQTHVDDAIRQGADTTRAAAQQARHAMWDVEHGAVLAVDDARDVAERLSRVATAFLESERAAMAHVGAATRVGHAGLSAWGTGLWVVRHAWALAFSGNVSPLASTGMLDGASGAIRPDGLPPTTGLLNRDTVQLALATMDVTGTGYASQVYALAAATALLEGLFGEGRATTVEPRSSSHAPRSPTGVADLMDGIQAEEDRMDGSVSIETVIHADGSRAHVVSIPGTEDWGVTSDNPHDAHGNFAAMSRQTTDAQRAITDAMLAAGIAPGEEVMLAGHSQGGINAAALAASPAFLSRFNVTHVVTAGSPVGRIALPPSVKALHLEHTEDLVAGLDATPNPATATRTTVERDLVLSGEPLAEKLGRTVGGAHHLSSYASTGALVDAGAAGTSASLWKESAATFFTGEASTLTEYVPVVRAEPLLQAGAGQQVGPAGPVGPAATRTVGPENVSPDPRPE